LFLSYRKAPAAAINALEMQLKEIEKERQKIMDSAADTK
jgi:hypothetical protein